MTALGNVLDCIKENSPTERDKDIRKECESSSVEVVALAKKPETGSNESSATIVTSEFEEAFSIIEKGNSFIFITGKAGTGKSTFIELLKSKLKSYAIVAPTGVAALNVGGQTIHSFFRIAPGAIDFARIKPVKNRIAYKALKTLIIDEISMVRADLLDAIDLMLRRNGRDENKPFGGVQVIVVGDLFQLPPVVSTEEEQAFLSRGYKSPFFFSANALQAVEMRSIEFSRVFRQTDEAFIAILNHLREGKQLVESLDLINKQVQSLNNNSFDGIVLSGTNATASKINSTNLNKTPGISKIYTGEITGEFRVDKEKLPTPFELELKEGARVMFTKNDMARRWVNGTIGTVQELGDNFVIVKIIDRYGQRIVRTEPETWKNLKYEYNADENAVTSSEVGSYKQIPLALAWAVTIHKSQGKTFDKVHINLSSGAFAEGQVYVALSRCRTLYGVTLERPIKKQDIQLNWDVVEFCRR